MNPRSSARSGAALALVAIRLDLPLESVDTLATITPPQPGPGHEEQTAVGGSCARFIEGEPEAWLDALPSALAIARLTDLATMAAALCIAESGREDCRATTPAGRMPSTPCISSPRNWVTPSGRSGITG